MIFNILYEKNSFWKVSNGWLLHSNGCVSAFHEEHVQQPLKRLLNSKMVFMFKAI